MLPTPRCSRDRSIRRDSLSQRTTPSSFHRTLHVPGDAHPSGDCFEDRFSRQAPTYRTFRPDYPDALFSFLAHAAPTRQTAWDCGTGNGQAAHALARFFERVIATDASSEQIACATAAPSIEFAIAPAERTPIASGTISLITVASALHWFDLPKFYEEARRVLIPGGVLAAWAYRECCISPEIDALIAHYQNDLVGRFWSSRIALVAARYATIDFPLEPLHSPDFVASASFSASDMLGYLASWSASQSYLEALGSAATTIIEPELRRLWGTERRLVRWPLFMRVGRFA